MKIILLTRFQENYYDMVFNKLIPSSTLFKKQTKPQRGREIFKEAIEIKFWLNL